MLKSLKYPLDRINGYVQLTDGNGHAYIPEWDLTRTGESRGSKEGDYQKYCSSFMILGKRMDAIKKFEDAGFELEIIARPDLQEAKQIKATFTASNGKRYHSVWVVDINDELTLDNIEPYIQAMEKTREKREKLIREENGQGA